MQAPTGEMLGAVAEDECGSVGSDAGLGDRFGHAACRLKRRQYRPGTLDGFITGTGLALDVPTSP
ncbi:hypothetical protein GCM10020367_58690 [Streptomyces sannanensis]|uniref:Transposase IS701-like DDE domain-containing protein n=1 Tax=Streptomyces sannanensis TaxID=285536 RepID=A0ABP6SKT4_9ACTN